MTTFSLQIIIVRYTFNPTTLSVTVATAETPVTVTSNVSGHSPNRPLCRLLNLVIMNKRHFNLKPETVTKLKNNWVIILPFLLLAIAYVLGRNEYENIKNNAAYTIGVVTNTNYQKGGKTKVTYRYQVGGKTYEDSDLLYGCSTLFDQVRGKNFTVIYNNLKPTQTALLLIEEDFNRFGMPFPDSLNWAKQSCQ